MATRARRGNSGREYGYGKSGNSGPPPGLQQTKTGPPQYGSGPPKKTYEYPPADGEVLVVMRYRLEMDRRIRNCIIRMKGKIGQPGTEGRCLGVTDQVDVLEAPRQSEWSQKSDWCMALFWFPSDAKARRWYESEQELKQHDFLPPFNGVQLFFVNLRYKVNPGKPLTFNWMELHNVSSKSYLQHEFVDKAATLLDDNQVNHGVVFLQDPGSPTQLGRLKESWLSHNADVYCVVNVFESRSHFERVYGKDTYAQLRGKRGEVCDTVSLVFTIDPRITGPPSTATCT